MDTLKDWLELRLWVTYLQQAKKGLLLAIPVAVLFELGGWWLRRGAVKLLGPALAQGRDRDVVERSRRRRVLRDATLTGLRWFWNALTVLVILTLWHVDPLAVALVLLAVVALLWSLWQDLSAGYALVLDDCLAPGDLVRLNHGQVSGTVEEVGLRRVRLRNDEGRLVWLRTRDITMVERLAAAPGGATEPTPS